MTQVDLCRLVISVAGRPAPQGSKHHGEHGQMRESSVYLPAWRAAVKKAVYERYRAVGIKPADLPLFRGPVGIDVTFMLDTGQRIDSAPDLDKLLRSTWDALTKARVWEDDGRAVSVMATKGAVARGDPTGAVIQVWPIEID